MECPYLPSPSQAVDAPEGSGVGGAVRYQEGQAAPLSPWVTPHL